MPKELQQSFDFGLTLPGRLKKTSWHLPTGLAFEDWKKCGECLQRIEGSVMWWLGDWWIFGDRAYGERAAQAIGPEDGGFSYQTYRDAGWVANAIEPSRRRDNVEWTKHREVAALEPDEQDEILGWAAGENATVKDVRAEVSRRKTLRRRGKIELDSIDPALPLGRKFPILYADPPWQYENPPVGGNNRSIENHYPTMAIEEICGLPVSDVAADDCVLFLWVTAPKLVECMKVVEAWGFEYRTEMVWVKDKIGMGYWFRNQHESLWVCKKGELPPPIPGEQPSSVLMAPRREHSAKPPEVAEMIERLYPELGKLELFSRSPRKGWHVWGNQIREAAE